MTDEPKPASAISAEERVKEAPYFTSRENAGDPTWDQLRIFTHAILLDDAIRIANEHADAAVAEMRRELAECNVWRSAHLAARRDVEGKCAEARQERDAARAEREALKALLHEVPDFGVFDCNAGMDAYHRWVENCNAALAQEPKT